MSQPEGMYMEDYGVVFLMKVNSPLSAPPEVQEEKTKESAKTVWEQAKQEIYAPENVRIEKKKSISAADYDAYKVEYLRESLIKAIKYAANIRVLKPDEWVIIGVSGSRPYENSAEILTIRVKKSDIDAFSKGESDFDSFRQKVNVLVY